MSLFRKRYYAGYGTNEAGFWFERNAQKYADLMNYYSAEFFGGEKFEVRYES